MTSNLEGLRGGNVSSIHIRGKGESDGEKKVSK